MASKKAEQAPKLSLEDMNRILNNVYAACQVEPSTTPLESIVAYTKYRQERFSIQKTIAMIAFVLFLLVPILFIAPRFSLYGSDSARDVVNIKVDNVSPVRSVVATMNGYNLPVYEDAEHNYHVTATENGELTVTVVLFNTQYNTQTYTVTGVDNSAPTLISNRTDGDSFYLVVTDGDGLGVDFEGVYGTAADGTTIKPLSYDETTGEIEFAYPSEGTVNVIIPDKNGNQLQLIVSATE